jgi:hypothetical protein
MNQADFSAAITILAARSDAVALLTQQVCDRPHAAGPAKLVPDRFGGIPTLRLSSVCLPDAREAVDVTTNLELQPWVCFHAAFAAPALWVHCVDAASGEPAAWAVARALIERSIVEHFQSPGTSTVSSFWSDSGDEGCAPAHAAAVQAPRAQEAHAFDSCCTGTAHADDAVSPSTSAAGPCVPEGPLASLPVVTVERHPHTGMPALLIHPCGTSELMAQAAELRLRGDTGAVASTASPAATRSSCEHMPDAAALGSSRSLGSLVDAAAVHIAAGGAVSPRTPSSARASAPGTDVSGGGHRSEFCACRPTARSGAVSSYLQLLSWCSMFLPLVGLALDPDAYAAEVARERREQER